MRFTKLGHSCVRVCQAGERWCRRGHRPRRVLLERQSQEVRLMLLRTSVLERVNGELADLPPCTRSWPGSRRGRRGGYGAGGAGGGG
jgi:hypothetical protein